MRISWYLREVSRKQTVVWLIRTGEGTQLQNWRCEAKQPRAGKEATVLRGDVRRGDWEEVVGKRGDHGQIQGHGRVVL